MEISFEEFKKVEMKVGQIIDVQEIPGSKNLYKLIVDFGEEKREAISGIKGYYTKDELLNKKFVFVTNLERKKFFGEESQCMILAAEKDGKIVLIQPEKDIENGAIIR
jgi:methionyl-tRNA synthetase